ncbi:hypothetical protein GN956_G14518 [Arapaima gigas]
MLRVTVLRNISENDATVSTKAVLSSGIHQLSSKVDGLSTTVPSVPPVSAMISERRLSDVPWIAVCICQLSWCRLAEGHCTHLPPPFGITLISLCHLFTSFPLLDQSPVVNGVHHLLGLRAEKLRAAELLWTLSRTVEWSGPDQTGLDCSVCVCMCVCMYVEWGE